jgi:hypothetical protein
VKAADPRVEAELVSIVVSSPGAVYEKMIKRLASVMELSTTSLTPGPKDIRFGHPTPHEQKDSERAKGSDSETEDKNDWRFYQKERNADQKDSETADDNVDLIPGASVLGQEKTDSEDNGALHENLPQASQIVCGMANEDKGLPRESQRWGKNVSSDDDNLDDIVAANQPYSQSLGDVRGCGRPEATSGNEKSPGVSSGERTRASHTSSAHPNQTGNWTYRICEAFGVTNAKYYRSWR